MDKKQMKIIGKRIFTLTFMNVLLIFTIVGALAQEIDINLPKSVSINEGSSDSLLSDMYFIDSDFYRVVESNNTIGMDFNVTFSDVKGDLLMLNSNQRYFGGASHDVVMSIYDYNISNFITLKTYPNTVNYEIESYNLETICNNCVKDGVVIINYLHPDSGINTHEFDIDYLILTSTGEEDIINDSTGLFNVDLNDDLTMILILLFIVAGAVLVFTFDGLVGGLLIIIGGLILLFNADVNIISVIIVFLGFTALFKDDNIKN